MGKIALCCGILRALFRVSRTGSAPGQGWNFLVNTFSMWPHWSQDHRSQWLRGFGVSVGEGTLMQPCAIGSPRVSIGPDSYIGGGCVFDGRAEVTIGARVALADEVMVVTSTHDHSKRLHRAGDARGLPVTIADGCWLGARVTVLPGVDVGEGCVIAAGAVVTRNCLPHGLYAGVPAVRVRDLS